MSEAQELLRLQELDLSLLRSKTALAKLPQKEQLQTVRLAIKKCDSKFLRLRGLVRDLEHALRDNRGEKSRFEGFVSEAKQQTQEAGSEYRRLQSLEQQLSYLAKQIEKLDFSYRALREDYLKQHAALTRLEAMLKELKARERELCESGAKKAQEISDTIALAQSEIKALKKTLSPELLARYSAAQKNFKGLAVEKLEHNRPSICRVVLRTRDFSQLKRVKDTDPITTCPYCQRILVLEQNQSQPAQEELTKDKA